MGLKLEDLIKAADLEPVPGDDGPTGRFRADVTAELTAVMLRRVAVALQWVGAAGLIVVVIQFASTWQSLAGYETGLRGWSQKIAIALAPTNTVLLSALVVGLGSLCRLAADWSTVGLRSGAQLPSTPVADDDDGS